MVAERREEEEKNTHFAFLAKRADCCCKKEIEEQREEKQQTAVRKAESWERQTQWQKRGMAEWSERVREREKEARKRAGRPGKCTSIHSQTTPLCPFAVPPSPGTLSKYPLHTIAILEACKLMGHGQVWPRQELTSQSLGGRRVQLIEERCHCKPGLFSRKHTFLPSCCEQPFALPCFAAKRSLLRHAIHSIHLSLPHYITPFTFFFITLGSSRHRLLLIAT